MSISNGLTTALTYDARQRLTSRQMGSETTSFDYWPTGLLKKVTAPDGSYLLYSYDTAHRLTQVSDGLGNAVDYTLDAMGNRTAENVYDPSNTLHRTHTRVFNTLNELFKDVNAAGTAAVTTTFGYDANGNQTSVAAPLSRNTANAYDELNRLKQVTDPAGGITQFGYNANDNLTSVTDPRSLTTAYSYNGFGDLSTQVSPDTGTTTNTYDSGGNLATSTDARGAVSTYTYDALNRVSSVAYSQGGTTDQTISFTYDAGTNGKSHLTSAADSNHSMSWTYDVLGRVTSKSQSVGGVTRSVSYAYTNGNLTALTTPSGQTVSYGYNANHQVTSVTVNGNTVLNSVTYEPLGPVSGWTWGNGATTIRAYDTDGKVSQIVSAGTKTFTYDDAFRVSGIADTSPGSANWTYGYDALDRITSGINASVTRGWTYDANGNRLTETGSSPSSYTVSATSNRIGLITGALARTYGYDADGNTTSNSVVTATYNNAGRLKNLAQGGSTATYLYNALGQRIQTSGGTAGTVLFWYDEAGHILGEYDGTGALIEETVWLGDIPVATVRPNGGSTSLDYVHSDQLNTPRQITRPSDNAQMWTWFSDPFGTDAANPNPAGAGSFAYNLRFPGQVFDGQAGLNANGYRDFDPEVGRYVESDPIGLGGGINTNYEFSRKYLRDRGFALPADGVAARAWCEREATGANTDAQYILAKFLSMGLFGVEDKKLAVHWAERASAQGYLPALLLLAGFHEAGWGGLQENSRRALLLTRQAAEGLYPPALTALASMYEAGHNVQQDSDQAMQLYKRAAALGDYVAQFHIGVALVNSTDAAEVSKGIQLLGESAKQEFPSAHRQLGYLYMKGAPGIAADPERSRLHFDAAEKLEEL